MRARRVVAAAAITITVAAGSAALPQSAEATVPTGATANSSGLVVTPGNGITATLGLTGAVGSLLAPIVNPVLGAVTSGVVTGLLGNPAANPPVPGLVANLVSALSTLTGATATTPTAQVTNPGTTFPSCSAAGWNSSTCYSLTSWLSTGALAPLINVTVPTVRGYTNADPSAANNQPMTSYAQIADPVISLLGIPIGDLGVITAQAVCPTTNSSTSASAATLSTTQTLTGVNLLGGLLKLSVASSTGLLMVQVLNVLTNTYTPAVAVSQLQSTLLSYTGLNVTVSGAGNGLQIGIALGLPQLLTALGLGAISGVTGLAGSSLALTISIGPGSSTVSSNGGTASATGLEVKVGLGGTLNLNILGLVGAALTVAPATGTGSADLLDLKLGNTSCAGGNAVSNSTVWYPPGLI